MNQWKKEFIKFTSSTDSPTFIFWVNLLNFFENYKNNLEINEIERIYDKSEELRLYINKKYNLMIESKDVTPNIKKYLKNKI